MPNMKQIILNHNKRILNKDNNTESKTTSCNCRIKEACPVNQKCQTSSLIYQATVTRHDNNKEESYIALTDNTFKTHTNVFNHCYKIKCFELTKLSAISAAFFSVTSSLDGVRDNRER